LKIRLVQATAHRLSFFPSTGSVHFFFRTHTVFLISNGLSFLLLSTIGD